MVPSNIGDPSCEAKEESLHRNDVNGIGCARGIDVRSRQPAAGEESSDVEEMTLDGDHIHGGDARGPWRPGGVGWRYSIGPARSKR